MTEPIDKAPNGDKDPAIEALVARVRRSNDPAAALLRPLPDSARSAMAERVAASLGAPKKRAPPPLRRLVWRMPLAAALALAALLFWLWPARGGPELVAYHLDVEGDASQRGPDSGVEGPVKLRPETKLRARLAPISPVRDVAIRLLVVRDGRATVISPPAKSDGQGTFTLEETAGALLGAQVDGPVELVFALGRPLPDDEALIAVALGRAKPPRSVRIERRSAVLQGFSTKLGALGFSGCRAVRSGPVCEIDGDSTVHVWTEGDSSSRLQMLLDGRPASASTVMIEGGARLSVTPARGSRALEVTLDGREVLSLKLDHEEETPLVGEADALRRKGQLDAAEAKLQEAERDPRARRAALRQRARIAFKRGDTKRSAALREEAIAASLAAGRTSDAVDDLTARVFELLYTDGALLEAKRRLDEAPRLDPGDAEDRVKITYYRGLVAGELGDVRGSLDALAGAWVTSRRFAVTSYEAFVAAPLADTFAALGRYDDAARVFEGMERSLAAASDPCQRAQATMNHGVVLMRSGKLGPANERLDVASRLAEQGCDPVMSDVTTNMAFARFEAGDTRAAKALLAKARSSAGVAKAWMKVWHERLAMEIALVEDPRAALAAAEEIRRAGEASQSPELLFEAQNGRARALDKLGDRGAGAAYAEAERALDGWAARVPLGEGRQTFLARQERAALGWIDYLHREALREGAPPASKVEVARAVRRSLGRFYRMLDSVEGGEVVAAHRAARARIDGSIRRGEAPLERDLALVRERSNEAPPPPLPAPPSGSDLALLYHPLPNARWLGVAWSSDGAVVKDLGSVSPSAGLDALSTLLIEPFADRVARASTVHVHAHRALDAVPFHRLPWRGGVVLDHAGVVVRMDVPPPPAAEPCARGPRALVVTDARRDLAAASASGRALEAALTARGYEVKSLRGDDAKVEVVRAALIDPCVRLFHYEGHAVSEGRDGVESALMLADGRLSAAQIVGLSRVPEAAVLSGCSTALAGGLGLAQAFLARGSTEVIATVAPVGDATAAQVGALLYEPSSPSGGIPPKLIEGFRRALGRLGSQGASHRDLAAYRVIGRS